ncbi:MAG: hypothetical protein LBN09_01700 [Clostridioides sp.]|jgi:hypothetical protein|nr:hypothetical protein [Clostridioides sp.]
MKIEFGADIEFRYGEHQYTILSWTKEGIVIGPQNSNDESVYKTADDFINNHLIEGKHIKDLIQDIDILFMA